MNKTLRIACYGRVDKNSTSGIAAQFVILEELLKRGYEIDYYGEKDYMNPQELLKYNNFRHVTVFLKPSIVKYLKSFISNSTILEKQFLPPLNALFFSRVYAKAVQDSIIFNHEQKKYNLLFFPELYSPFNINEIPVVNWTPDLTNTEWYFIQKQWKNVISLCGIILYFKKKVFCSLKNNQRRSDLKKNSDFLICGSQWSKAQHIAALNFNSNMIKSLPYPIDTNVFKSYKTHIKARRNEQKIFLWLGRIEPRKRLDLLLDAYKLILQERQDVQLKIVGSVKSEFAGYKKLLDSYEYRHLIDYQPSIDRSKIPELMAQCDVLVQPSEGENFGTSVAEALCCGLPVIVGSTNGTKDFISPSSFIFENYTPESLKKTMLQAIEAIDQEREKLAMDARETAEKNFSVHRVVDSLEDIFQEALNIYQSTSNSLFRQTGSKP